MLNKLNLFATRFFSSKINILASFKKNNNVLLSLNFLLVCATVIITIITDYLVYNYKSYKFSILNLVRCTGFPLELITFHAIFLHFITIVYSTAAFSFLITDNIKKCLNEKPLNFHQISYMIKADDILKDLLDEAGDTYGFLNLLTITTAFVEIIYDVFFIFYSKIVINIYVIYVWLIYLCLQLIFLVRSCSFVSRQVKINSRCIPEYFFVGSFQRVIQYLIGKLLTLSFISG